MFKKSKLPQIDLFRTIGNHISERKAKLLDAPSQWHNVFCKEVTNRIDEDVFKVLFNDGGRPNASLRCLVAMMIIKEGQGWSDSQLFMECRFNLMMMRSLGLHHIDDDVPVESTYYEFRRRLSDHYRQNGVDLIAKSFQGVVQGQIETHKINGEKIRLDSKLIQSNIAKSGRLELLLETLRVSTKNMDLSLLGAKLSDVQLSLLKALQENTVSNITYSLTSEDKRDLLKSLGFLIKQLLPYTGQDTLLRRVYTDHYTEDQPKEGTQDKIQKEDAPQQEESPEINLKKNNEISSDSLQSVHDPEATYRSKGQGKAKKQVTGYHSNITETCSSENEFNLITQLDVSSANVCEDAFLQSAISQSQEVVSQQINHVTTDGGYDSISNREVMALDDQPHWNMSKNKGAELRYELSYNEQHQLKAYCKKTKKWCQVLYSEKADKYCITHQDHTKRYLTKEQIEHYLITQAHHHSQRKEDINIRPNVESTIHQVFHRLLKRDKIKYRGLYKCKMYVTSRAYWTNFRRILKNEVKNTAFRLYYMILVILRHLEASRHRLQQSKNNTYF